MFGKLTSKIKNWKNKYNSENNKVSQKDEELKTHNVFMFTDNNELIVMDLLENTLTFRGKTYNRSDFEYNSNSRTIRKIR